MKRIAIVEDNPDNRLLLQAILEDQFNITEHEDGTSALQAFTESTPDLVLMDISLRGGMSGQDVLSRLRDDPAFRNIPVIALTAHAMLGDRQRFLDAVFDDYVTKPVVDESILIGAIERLLPGA